MLHKFKTMYNPNRLSGIRRAKPIENPIDFCVVLPDNRRTFDWFQSFVVALAKSQDHRASCGVFAFGLPNAVRRWLGKRYPVTRANQSGERGLRIERGGRAEGSASLSSVSDGMAPKSIPSKRSGTVMSHGKGCALLQHSPKSIK